MALYHFRTKVFSRSSRNTVRAIAYRAGCKLYDQRTGQSFDYRDKPVQHVELALPKDAPEWAREIQELIKVDRQKGVQALVDIVEGAEKRINSRVWREFEFSLHRELTEEQNMTLAREFVQDQLCMRGMLAKLNFHFEVDEKTGEYNPHCHVAAATRRLEKKGMGTKEREWNTKSCLFELREQWAHYSNFYLKLYGHDVQIDQRSNKERGIEMEPQPKLGKGIIEQEKRIQKLEGIEEEEANLSPITDKMQAFQAAQLRNLYRIMRNPDVILDIVTKHHATFMWADVQKKLHQYVDNPALFERLEYKIKASSELLLLRIEKVQDSSGMEHDKAIYTTRSMLKAERSLIEHAEELGNSKTHGAQGKNIELAIEKANEKLKEHGGLSEDQIKAIHHLVDEGQIKCVVGIAGAGKTTAIGVCHEIWKAEGYAVYGLAPTGKASQNLEGSSLEDNGIPSTTLHKFLKSFEEGRCQYNEKSILVLDEAGMVDVERFEKLLSAVKHLGVKLIVVGDGAQLQPVEAGPAFRLVTEKLGRSELNTVVRQKEEWQREATVLFGQQKTAEAIRKYEEKECVHIVEEKLPSLKDAINNKNYDDIVHLYEASHRVSFFIYREMAKNVQREYPDLKKLYPKIREHKDFQKYLEWKDIEKDAAGYILENAQKCRPALEARNVDTLQLALVFKDPQQDKFTQQERAKAVLKECGLEHLIGQTKKRGQTVDTRQTAKEELIQTWHTTFKENPEKSTAILAYSNRDVNDLNRQVRSLLKESGQLSKGEFTFSIKREIEDDFGRKHTLKEEKGFSKGDRIVFTKNKYWAGVRNGTMGTITDINNRNIKVKLDEGKEISFAPNLNPHFDQGWAITIHKSQGTTVDQTYVLASFEMTQNLAYVAMTRQRERVKMFGSSLDFWRKEKLPEILSKSGEKLSAADYLDAETLTKIMKQDDQILTKFFQRMSNELEAMGAVTKEVFWNVADHFLGRTREKEIRILEGSVREEVRAEVLFKKEDAITKEEGITLKEKHSTKVQHQPLNKKTKQHLEEKEEKVTPFLALKEDPTVGNPLIEKALIEKTSTPIKVPEKIIQQQFSVKSLQHKREVVENALKTHMADFADHVFTSLGIAHNRAMSSRTERRYGGKGGFSVNLQKGVWYSHNDSQMKGGPLQLLTKLKNLSYKEAIEYGASWASLSPEQLKLKKQFNDLSHSQRTEKEAIEKAKDLEEIKQKIERAQAIWAKGKPIQGTLAARYLRDHRNIKGDLPQDLLYLPANGLGKASPSAFMAAARSPAGDVTAIQLTFLDSHTANKATIPIQKRTFGSLKGSAITIQADKSSNLLFIAEGVETALSLKEAGIKGTIKASLGLSNIKNLKPQDPNTHIIICGDPDDPDSPATKTLEKSSNALQKKGFKVTVIKPDKLGEDFNDVLKAKGPEGVRNILEQVVPHALMNLEKTQKPSTSLHKTTLEVTKEEHDILHQITRTCEQHLYAYISKENISLTSKLKERIPLQAERAANFIFYAHIIKGTEPTEKETKLYLARAKYELDRLPHIKEKLTEEWQKQGKFNDKSSLLIHMIAERQASIEGRLFLEAKQRGQKPSPHIPKLTETEFAHHKAQTKPLAQKLSTKHSLSEDAALQCAKDALRYKETHGEKLTKTQITTIAAIARQLEAQYPAHLEREMGSHNITYMRRMEGDALFREHCYHEKTAISLEHEIMKMQEKTLKIQKNQIDQESIKQQERDFSFSL